ncbi:MAG: hypothetical protein ACOX28_01350 [Bacilli bacterium]|jgi:putative IMPACT (imprinted ancient) family translation regulator
MKTIIAPVKNEIIVEKSRFIALLFPLTSEEEALTLLDSVVRNTLGHVTIATRIKLMILLDLAMMANQREPQEFLF